MGGTGCRFDRYDCFRVVGGRGHDRLIGIDSPTDFMLLLRIDLEMNIWVVPFCGFGIRTTNIKNGSSTDVEIKAHGESGP